MSSAVSVRPVHGRGDFTTFINYPYQRHASDPHWVPPLRLGERERLNPRKNPFFAHAEVELFLAWRAGRIAGRIAAIDDALHRATHHDNTGMFGFFEAEDAETAQALLRAAEDWAHARGRDRLRGPINPSLNDHAGLLIDGFDTDPMVLMPHNPREYAAFIESAGYAKAKDLYAWLYHVDRAVPPIIVRLAERLRERHALSIRPFSVKEFTREAEQLRQLYCSAWERNWGFTPPTKAEFARIANEIKPIFDPRIALCAEIDSGSTGRTSKKMIACVVAIPDINQAMKGTGGRLFPLGLPKLLLRKRYIDQARVILLGIDPAYRSIGVYPLLVHELHRRSQGGPYKRAEFSWVLEDNRDINQPAEQMGARRYKTYRIYEKRLA